MQHLPQRVRAATRRVLFFMSDHVAWAHGVVVGLALFSATFTNAHTTHGGMPEASVIFRILKVRGGFVRMIAGAVAQIFINARRLDYFARVHLPVGIPNRLELAKCSEQFR